MKTTDEKSPARALSAFDLDRALAGEKLISRSGYEVTNFRENPGRGSYRYRAEVGVDSCTFTKEGKHWADSKVSQYDLFMAKPVEEVKFYYSPSKKFWDSNEVIAKQGLKYSIHLLFDESQDQLNSYSFHQEIEIGDYVEVDPADWPANVTNSFILKHINRNIMSRQEITKIAVKPTNQTEFDQLWAIFQLGGQDVGHMKRHGYKAGLNQYWGVLSEFVQGWSGDNWQTHGSVIYDSVADYLNNKPTQKYVRVRLNSNYEAEIYEAEIKDSLVIVGCQQFTFAKIKELAAAINGGVVTIDNSAVFVSNKKQMKRLYNLFQIGGKDVSVMKKSLDLEANGYWGNSSGTIFAQTKGGHTSSKHFFICITDFLDAVGSSVVRLNSECVAEIGEKETVVTHAGQKIVIPNSAILELAAKLN